DVDQAPLRCGHASIARSTAESASMEAEAHSCTSAVASSASFLPACGSLIDETLMRTLYAAPLHAASASSAATPASLTAFVFPFRPHVAASFATSTHARAGSSGTAAAFMSAAWIAASRLAVCSGDSFGILYAALTSAYESAS